jgi:hypothetical protein
MGKWKRLRTNQAKIIEKAGEEGAMYERWGGRTMVLDARDLEIELKGLKIRETLPHIRPAHNTLSIWHSLASLLANLSS